MPGVKLLTTEFGYTREDSGYKALIILDVLLPILHRDGLVLPRLLH